MKKLIILMIFVVMSCDSPSDSKIKNESVLDTFHVIETHPKTIDHRGEEYIIWMEWSRNPNTSDTVNKVYGKE